MNDIVTDSMSILWLKVFDPLTDEETKDKYEKMGNPDGSKGIAVANGLLIYLRDIDSEWVHCSGGVVQHQQFQSIQIIENRLKIKRN